MSDKLDLYRNVHKAQRARLFELAFDLGRADYENRAAVDALAERVQALVAELRDHAAHEERYIHPLLRAKVPEIAAMLELGHGTFDELLSRVQGMAVHLAVAADCRLDDGLALYRAFCEAVSVYLRHLSEEETVAMPALWETCSQQELLGVMRSFVASRSESDRMNDLVGQVPALTPQERIAYVRAAANGDGQRARAILEKLQARVAPADLDRLKVELAIC